MSESEQNNNLQLDLKVDTEAECADSAVTDNGRQESKDDSWVIEDSTSLIPTVDYGTDEATEETIIPQKSQSLNIRNPFSSKGRNIKTVNRSDNFRRIIRRKSSNDKSLDIPDKSPAMQKSESEDSSGKIASDNEANEALERNGGASGDAPHIRDSVESGSISIERYLEDMNSDPTIPDLPGLRGLDAPDGDPAISRPLPHTPDSITATDPDDHDSASETSSVHTEDGINDSITNVELLRAAAWDAVVWLAAAAWGWVLAGVRGVFAYLTGGGGGCGQDETEGGAGVGREGLDGIAEGEAEAEEAVLSEKDKKRIFNIVNELLTTEREYVKRLGILVKIKARTSVLLQPDAARSMFQNIEVIHQFHRDNLLPQLESRIRTWDEQPIIGDIMRKLAPFLKLYTEYVKNFTAANQLFEASKQKSSSFNGFVLDAENNIEYGRLKVQAHMLEPVQRVPRYELLLKDYLKKIPEDSNDRADTEEALVLVASAAQHFEEMMKRDSRILQLMQLSPQFEGCPVPLVESHRELLTSGKVKLINIRAGKISDRVLHLFSDLLLVSGEQSTWVPGAGDKFRVKHTFHLRQSQVVYGNNLEIPHTFYVKSSDNFVELAASSAEERNRWLDKLHTAISNCCEDGDNKQAQLSTYNDTTIEDGFMLQRYTFQLSSDNKSWKKRCLSLYDNGLLAVSRSTTDKQIMSSVHVCNFHISVTLAQQKKGKVIILNGQNRTYQLYDDNHDFVDGWFHAIKALSSKYSSGSCEEEVQQTDTEWSLLADDTSSRSSGVRLSTISDDSGVSLADTPAGSS